MLNLRSRSPKTFQLVECLLSLPIHLKCLPALSFQRAYFARNYKHPTTLILEKRTNKESSINDSKMHYQQNLSVDIAEKSTIKVNPTNEIVVKNAQHLTWVNLNRIRFCIKEILQALNLPNHKLSVEFADSKTIRNLNRVFRSKGKDTDILSFPSHEYAVKGDVTSLLSSSPSLRSSLTHNQEEKQVEDDEDEDREQELEKLKLEGENRKANRHTHLYDPPDFLGELYMSPAYIQEVMRRDLIELLSEEEDDEEEEKEEEKERGKGRERRKEVATGGGRNRVERVGGRLIVQTTTENDKDIKTNNLTNKKQSSSSITEMGIDELKELLRTRVRGEGRWSVYGENGCYFFDVEDERLEKEFGVKYGRVDVPGVAGALFHTLNLEKRYCLLLVHGVLHCLGYDHETEEDWREMTAREEEVMGRLKGVLFDLDKPPPVIIEDEGERRRKEEKKEGKEEGNIETDKSQREGKKREGEREEGTERSTPVSVSNSASESLSESVLVPVSVPIVRKIPPSRRTRLLREDPDRIFL